MNTKVQEFLRINEPRVQRALEQIGHIEKSARSMSLPEEGAQLLSRISAYIGPAAPPVAPVAATPPIAREMRALSELSTQQLVDRMIACGAELASRRK